MDKSINENELRSELSEKVAHLKSEINKRDELIKKQKKIIGSLEMFEGNVINSIEALPKANIKPYDISKSGSGKKDHDSILCLTDTHSEEFVSSAEMEGYAKYEWEDFLNRMWHTGQKTIDLVRSFREKNKCDRLHVLLLGDMLTGVIHDELDRTNTMSLPDAVVKTSNILSQTLLKMSSEFDVINVECSVGNHGRQDKKPPSKQKVVRNWDYAVYIMAKEFTRANNKIVWNIPESPAHIVNVLGAKLLTKHGENIRSTGIIPYYGIYRDAAEEQKKRQKDGGFDYMILGHWHHLAILDGKIVLCPSLIGPNQYSFNRLNTSYPAEQLLMFSTDRYERGIINFMPIQFNDIGNHEFSV